MSQEGGGVGGSWSGVVGLIYAQLRQKVGKRLMKQWHEATKALCSSAYAPYGDGTIYPQLMVGCDDHLSRALLKEFKRMGEQ